MFLKCGYKRKEIYFVLRNTIHNSVPQPLQNKTSYVPLIRQCTNANLLNNGMCIHAAIIEDGKEQDTLVMNLILHMYGHCGAVDDAYAAFRYMGDRNVFSWTIMIGVYAQHGRYKEGLNIFMEMEPSGVKPNKVTFITIASLCASLRDISQSKLIHSYIQKGLVILDVTVGNALISMYDKCGSPEDSYLVFQKIDEPDVISWNAIIAAHLQHGEDRKALQLFHHMQMENVIPDHVTFINTLDAKDINPKECKRMHAYIIASGFESNIKLGTSIVCMYGKNGQLDRAWEQFNDVSHQSTVVWNAILSVFQEHMREENVPQLFQQMLHEGIIPDKVTFVALFSSCACSHTRMKQGKFFHSSLYCYTDWEWDLILWNSLINMYGKCGLLTETVRIFRETPERDIVSWNELISAHVQNESGEEALQLFDQMQLECILPNKFTLVIIVYACANNVGIRQGKHIHARVVSSGFYGIGVLEQEILYSIKTESLISDTVNNVQHDYKLSSQTQPTTESNIVVGNALINMYTKCHNLKTARMIFEKMAKRDVVSWTTMAAAYAQEGMSGVTSELFYKMQSEGVIPNKTTFINILNAFSEQSALEGGQMVHSFIVEHEPEVDVELENAMMNMYGKCGCLNGAQWVLDKMHVKNSISWTIMITNYSRYGLLKKVCDIYRDMQQEGSPPNEVTYVSILSTCSYAGLIDEGYFCFSTMCESCGIVPTVEHYNCIIDLLTRAGNLEEGTNMIEHMPMSPAATTWVTLLGACSGHGDLQQASYVAKKIFELDPENSTPYVLLSNIFASDVKMEDEHL